MNGASLIIYIFHHALLVSTYIHKSDLLSSFLIWTKNIVVPSEIDSVISIVIVDWKFIVL